MALEPVDEGEKQLLQKSTAMSRFSRIWLWNPVIGMVWYGLVWGVKPNHTRCLHNNRYGITGKTNNTSKDAKT
ncbi:Hybrid PKS-NRPS synthetase lepA, partial [Fusarium oxysporum f. sp. albedinis]